MRAKHIQKKKKRLHPVVPFVCGAILLAGILFLAYFLFPETEVPENKGEPSPHASITEPVSKSEPESVEEGAAAPEATDAEVPEADLGNGLYVTEIGSYTGLYMEDGTDEPVSGILMLKLENRSPRAVEYAVLAMQMEDGTAEFTVSALMPGATVLLLEKNRMLYQASETYEMSSITCENLAQYAEELSLQEDRLEIRLVEGAMNVKNISQEDISGKIVVYYKNKVSDLYYGGIAYRSTIDGGIRAGEMRQKMSGHLSGNACEILFVEIVEE